MYCERASSNYRTTIGCYWRHLVYSHSLLVHSRSRGQAVYALSPIGEVFYLFKKVNTKKPFMMESDPMTLFLQSTTIDTAGGLTIDCNLFTMARACVRKFFCFLRQYQDSVVDKTCSTKDFECQHVGIPFTIFHPWWGAFFRCPAKQINCRKTLARVKVIARSNWSSEIVGSSHHRNACCHDNYPVNNRNERYQTPSHHRKKGILLSTWSAWWRCERFLLGARVII